MRMRGSDIVAVNFVELTRLEKLVNEALGHLVLCGDTAVRFVREGVKGVSVLGFRLGEMQGDVLISSEVPDGVSIMEWIDLAAMKTINHLTAAGKQFSRESLHPNQVEIRIQS